MSQDGIPRDRTAERGDVTSHVTQRAGSEKPPPEIVRDKKAQNNGDRTESAISMPSSDAAKTRTIQRETDKPFMREVRLVGQTVSKTVSRVLVQLLQNRVSSF
jgi:hypothetical protein